MKKIINILTIILISIVGVISLTGCNKNSNFEFVSKTEKNVIILAKNVKKGDSIKATVNVSEGENVVIKTSIKNDSRVSVKIYETNIGESLEPVSEEKMHGDGEILLQGLLEQNHDIYITSLDSNLNGTIEIIVE